MQTLFVFGLGVFAGVGLARLLDVAQAAALLGLKKLAMRQAEKGGA